MMVAVFTPCESGKSEPADELETFSLLDLSAKAAVHSGSELIGQIAIVTGAAHGFGRAIALALARCGARVLAADVLREELQETAAMAPPGAVTAILCDVTSEQDISVLLEKAAVHGTVDILVSNAGGVLGQVGKPLEEVALCDWQSLFDINCTALFRLAQLVAPGMKRQGRGRIVSISSGAGLGVSLTGIQAYASSKAANIGLCRQLAHELGPHGISVNNVAPGFVRCNPASVRQWEGYSEERRRAILERVPLRRLGEPEDIAHAVLFLVGPGSSWVSGQCIAVDGGHHMR